MTIIIQKLSPNYAAVDSGEFDDDTMPQLWLKSTLTIEDIDNIHIAKCKPRIDGEKWQDVLYIEHLSQPGIYMIYKPFTETVEEGFTKLVKLHNDIYNV